MVINFFLMTKKTFRKEMLNFPFYMVFVNDHVFSEIKQLNYYYDSKISNQELKTHQKKLEKI